jgi:uracil phosphoribosyltransferase
MGKLKIFDHPLINHKLAIIRAKETNTKLFRETVDEIGALMAYEVTRDLPTELTEVETPLAKTMIPTLAKEVVIVPILRAGLGMVAGIQQLIPTAKVGHVGMYRDEETLKPQQYYFKVPPTIQDATVLVLDPMLATGGSVAAAVTLLKNAGAKDIRFVGIVGCPTGVDVLQNAHPDVDIYLAALDPKLNDKSYIVPGLGDAGDRLYGTK